MNEGEGAGGKGQIHINLSETDTNSLKKKDFQGNMFNIVLFLKETLNMFP